MKDQYQTTKTIAPRVLRHLTPKKLGLGLAGIALLAGTLCGTGFGQKYYRLGGAWVGGRPGFMWTSLTAPLDPLGQTAAARPILKYADAQFAGLLAAFGADNLSDATGEVRMFSPDTARWTLIAYAQATPHQPGDLLQNKAIVMYSGTWKYTSDDTAVLNYAVNVYLPSADADGDGYPDPGAQPVLTIPGIVDNARRVPIL
ncbi:MAG TPA: hypothetical protein VJA21_08490 [Verrucomicrobiae bacterium]